MYIDVPINNIADWVELWIDHNDLKTDWEAILDEAAEEDTETAHSLADMCLCRILEELGFYDVVERYEQIPKWYA